jgi:hypothetical protein
MNEDYDLENVRKLLIEGFNAEELRSLCFDKPALRPVYDNLSESVSKSELTRQIVDYANKKLVIEMVLDWARIHNPSGYEKYEPYKVVDSQLSSSASAYNPDSGGRRIPKTVMVGAVLIFIVVSIVSVYLLLIQSRQSSTQATQTGEASLAPMAATATVTLVIPTAIVTMETHVPTTQVLPTSTPTEAPTLVPTTMLPCNSNGECSTDFNTLDTRVWCGPLQPYELSNDQLVIKADGGTKYEFKPCLGDEPLKFVELILSIDRQPGMASEYSYAGLETGPDFSFKLNSLGGGFVNKGWDSKDEQVFSATIGSTHTLRIEWTDNGTQFFVDGTKQYESDPVGSNWFSLVVKADLGRDITAIFDSVRWGYLFP